MKIQLLLAGTALTALAPLASGTPGGQECRSTCTAARTADTARDVVDTALAAGTFTSLAQALAAADLVATLKGDGPFTVFAPSDEAFARLPEKTRAALFAPEGRAHLVALLAYHVVPADLDARAVAARQGVDTVNGQRLEVRLDDGQLSVGGARVVRTDVACSNGRIHVIDRVLQPSALDLVGLAQGSGKLGTLLAAAQAAGLADTLASGGPFTLLAPTDEAFARLGQDTLESLLRPENRHRLADILRAHVVEGRAFSDQVAALAHVRTLQGSAFGVQHDGAGLAIGGARVLESDLQAANGVVHVIDRVLLPH